MKTCPSCRTLYTDDTLRFCLQDGTPLIAAPDADEPNVSLSGQEEETAVRARRTPRDADAPVDTAWKSESQVDRVSPTALPKRRASTLAIASLAAAIVLLFLTIAGAIGLWLYFRDSGGDIAKNTDNVRGDQNSRVNSNLNRNSAAQPTPTTANNSNGNANLPAPSPTPPAVDKTQASGEVSEAITGWIEESEQGDLDSLIGRYANSVEYYQRKGASPDFIRADKQRAFRTYDSLAFDISNVDISIGDSGETATAVFDKEWVFEGPRRSTGKVQQLLQFRRIGGAWRITGERDLRVYYTN